MSVEVEGSVEIAFRVRVPVTEGARLTGLLSELAALNGATIAIEPAALEEPAAPQLPAPAEQPPSSRICAGCGAGRNSRAHYQRCLGREYKARPRSSAKKPEPAASVVLPEPDDAPKKRRGRPARSHGMVLGAGADEEPDYSEHGRLWSLPAGVITTRDGERIVRVPIPGDDHVHTFKLPEANVFSESLGRCACGETRRYSNVGGGGIR